MDDVLARFRAKPIASAASASAPLAAFEPPKREEYVAFAAKDSVARLRIRRASDEPTNSPSYGLVLNVIYDRQGTHIILVYSLLMVLLRGRNLQQLVFALENEKADFIQEYDAKRWPPPDDKAAFIESIEIADRESAASVIEAQEAYFAKH